MIFSDLYTFIAAKPYAVLSTIAANGTPQSALIGIAVTPNLEIIFDTLTTTRKYANLLARPTCSLVIGWDDEQTLQYEGTAFLPSGPDLTATKPLLRPLARRPRPPNLAQTSPTSSSAPPGSATATSTNSHPPSKNSISASSTPVR